MLTKTVQLISLVLYSALCLLNLYFAWEAFSTETEIGALFGFVCLNLSGLTASFIYMIVRGGK